MLNTVLIQENKYFHLMRMQLQCIYLSYIQLRRLQPIPVEF